MVKMFRLEFFFLFFEIFSEVRESECQAGGKTRTKQKRNMFQVVVFALLSLLLSLAPREAEAFFRNQQFFQRHLHSGRNEFGHPTHRVPPHLWGQPWEQKARNSVFRESSEHRLTVRKYEVEEHPDAFLMNIEAPERSKQGLFQFKFEGKNLRVVDRGNPQRFNKLFEIPSNVEKGAITVHTSNRFVTLRFPKMVQEERVEKLAPNQRYNDAGLEVEDEEVEDFDPADHDAATGFVDLMGEFRQY